MNPAMNLESYRYREIPASVPGAPTLALFHGTGGDENQFLDLAPQLMTGARLVAIRGDVSENGSLRYFKRTGEGVYDMDDLSARVEKMAGFLGAVRDEGPLFALGYSNGANIIAATMFAHPDLFDGVVLMHPLIPFDPAPRPGLEGKPVLVTAGRADPICPAPLTEKLIDMLAARGARVDAFWHAGGHEVRQEELRAIAEFTQNLGG